MYDSMQDTLKHISNIQTIFSAVIIPEIEKRSENHDLSKLRSPEKETLDKYIPLLREVKYGTDEYKTLKKSMYEEGLSSHFKNNRHHPEHFENGVNDMNLIDLLEMVCDWFAASLRSDTSFSEGLEGNFKEYKIDPQLAGIIKNTYEEYFAPIEGKLKSTQN